MRSSERSGKKSKTTVDKVSQVNITANVFVLIGEGIHYKSISKHRPKNKNKYSVWIIPVPEEVNCFKYSHLKKWLLGAVGWGLYLKENKPEELGRSASDEPLKIAKFVDKDQKGTWHGYPADFRKNQQDRPSMSILEAWRKAEIIKKHQIAKIRAGQKCGL